MRTSEQFKSAWKDLEWFLKFHKKSVWLVPSENNYTLSIVKPDPHELPFGTAANFYDVDLNIVETIKSSATA